MTEKIYQILIESINLTINNLQIFFDELFKQPTTYILLAVIGIVIICKIANWFFQKRKMFL